MSAALSERVGRVVAYPPLSEMDDRQRQEFQEALLDADGLRDHRGRLGCSADCSADPQTRFQPVPVLIYYI